ncbi:MAG: G-D-S-L family lipolytic protein [Flavobacteriaceae bacterium]|nr:MAG: G-D-S-L family lipolytic protein [Flavobacteriaceae bacterium]
MKKIIFIITAALLVTSCSNNDLGVTPFIHETNTVVTPSGPTNYTSGIASFANFVSVGNSLTAGYSDGALFITGQENSFPNILAQQFSLADGGAFTQPLMNDNLGGLLLGGNQITSNRLFLSFASGDPAPTPVSGSPTTEVSDAHPGPYNNMGVPGAKSFHLGAPGYGNVAGVAIGAANPFYARMASSPNAAVIQDAVSQNPTFFSLWIGNNDILSYAISGGSGVDQNGNFNPATYGSEDITDPNVFASVYNGLLQALTANGADGIVTNLPRITTIPYFTTVPYNAIPLDAATASTLNAAFAAYNGGLQFVANNTPYLTQAEANRRMVHFIAGHNPVLILDEDLTDLTGINPALTNMRQATSDDLLVLTSRTFLGTTVGGNPQLINGVSVPLADKWVLTPKEQAAIENARLAFNQTIQGLASQYGLAFFDADALMQQMLASGITENGITTTAVYATGGGFSLDGVHPSPRGYAIIANAMIDAINQQYQSNMPHVNIGIYTGVYLN